MIAHHIEEHPYITLCCALLVYVVCKTLSDPENLPPGTFYITIIAILDFFHKNRFIGPDFIARLQSHYTFIIWFHAYIHRYIQTHAYIHTDSCIHTYRHRHVCLYTHTYIHTDTHAYPQACLATCMHTYIFLHVWYRLAVRHSYLFA